MSPNIFFIAGCQRSGTTLLRLVLESHPELECFDEVDGYRILATGVNQVRSAKPLVGFKIPRWTEQLLAPLLWDYGLPERPSRFYSGQKIIFMVRNVKDTIASMLKLRTGTATWLETWGEPIIEQKIQKDPAFAHRYSRELHLRAESTNRQVASGAFYWKYKNDAFFDLVHSGCPVLPVVYESLVCNPRSELERICSFLGIRWHAAMLEHPRLAHREVFETGLTLGNTDPKRPIDAASVDQWESFIPREALPDIEAIAGTTQRQLQARISKSHSQIFHGNDKTNPASYR